MVNGMEGNLNDIFHMNLAGLEREWTKPATFGTPPSPRSGCAYAQRGDVAFVFGGYGIGFYNDLYMLDLSSYAWIKIEPTGSSPPPARFYSSMTMVNDDRSLFVCGGRRDNVFSDCWVFEIEENMWRELKNHKFDGRCEHTASKVGNDIMVFGGTDVNKKIIKERNSFGRFSFE